MAAAVQRLVDELRTPEMTLLTIYAGEEVREGDAQALVTSLREQQHPSLEIELVPGGQPHYPYLLSLE